MSGYCSYRDVYDLSLEDFYLMNEIIQVKNENERRAHRAMERASKAK